MTQRHVVLHGHFYQPPRADPWYEEVPRQPSAAPQHDWNVRVCQECYAPNTAARLLDGQGRVRGFVDNYRGISFDFGPTLMEWLQCHAENTYASVLEADRESRRRLGYGNAIAQAHGHLIMPLASERDRHTQVAWGMADFAARFGRDPEGMWLPETAVDVATLEVLAAHGIRFTVLAPSQAWRFRAPGAEWQGVQGDIEGRSPYLLQLPSGRSLALFFYDGYLSRGVAFEGLLQSGERLVSALLGAFDADPSQPQLVHVATDGETYGHHHRFGEMALAYALDALGRRDDVRLTNYAAYLAANPPHREVEIRERTSWSCAHGIERWRSDCGCHTGGRPGWSQQWRAPLRQALDELAAQLGRQFERHAGELLRDPWAARDAYVELLLQGGHADRRAWLRGQARQGVDARGVTRALAWLESQRHAMAMFTSCGWFFNDVSGIETEQVLLHAARALQLARDAGGIDLEPELVERLRQARSNRPGEGTAADLWERRVLPRMATRTRVAAAATMLTLLQEKRDHLGAYALTSQVHALIDGEDVRATVEVRDPRDLSRDERLVHARFQDDRLVATARIAAGAEATFDAVDLLGADGSIVTDALLAREAAHVLSAQRRLLRRSRPPARPGAESELPELQEAERAVAEADLLALLQARTLDPAGLAEVAHRLQPRRRARGGERLTAHAAAALQQALVTAAGAAADNRRIWLAILLQLARLRRDRAPEIDVWQVQQRVHVEVSSAATNTEECATWHELADLFGVQVDR